MYGSFGGHDKGQSVTVPWFHDDYTDNDTDNRFKAYVVVVNYIITPQYDITYAKTTVITVPTFTMLENEVSYFLRPTESVTVALEAFTVSRNKRILAVVIHQHQGRYTIYHLNSDHPYSPLSSLFLLKPGNNPSWDSRWHVSRVFPIIPQFSISVAQSQRLPEPSSGELISAHVVRVLTIKYRIYLDDSTRSRWFTSYNTGYPGSYTPWHCTCRV